MIINIVLKIKKKMIKKKDKFLDILKNNERYPILSFLEVNELHNLALASKKYYMQLLPFIKVKELDDQQSESSSDQEKSKSGKNKNNKKKNGKI